MPQSIIQKPPTSTDSTVPPEQAPLEVRQCSSEEDDRILPEELDVQVQFSISAQQSIYKTLLSSLTHIYNGFLLSLINTYQIRMAALAYVLNSTHTDTAHRAATPLIEHIIGLYSVVGASPLLSINPIASRTSNKEAIARLGQQSAIMTFVMTTLVTLPLNLASESSVELFTKKQELIEIASPFLSVYAWNFPVIFPALAAQQLLIGLGYTKTAIVAELVKAAFIISLGILIAFNTDYKENGYVASGIAVESIALLGYLLFTRFHSDMKTIPFFHLQQNFITLLRDMKPLVSLGAAILGSNIIYISNYMVSGVLTGSYDLSAQAALSTANWYKSFPMFFLHGLVLHTNLEMNRLIKEESYSAASQMGQRGLLITFVAMSALIAAGAAVYLLFINNPASQNDLFNKLLPIIASNALVDVVHMSLANQLRDVLNSASLVNGIACVQLFTNILGCFIGKQSLGIMSIPISQLCSTSIATAGLGYFWKKRTTPERITEMDKARRTSRARHGFFPIAIEEENALQAVVPVEETGKNNERDSIVIMSQ